MPRGIFPRRSGAGLPGGVPGAVQTVLEQALWWRAMDPAGEAGRMKMEVRWIWNR